MNERRRVPLYGYLFLIAVFAKQFYTFSSGSIQIGDMLFVLSFLFMALSGNKVVTRENQKLLVFVVLAGVINGIYGFLYSETSINLSTIYLVFNLLVVFIFESLIYNRKFIFLYEQVLKLCILSQLAIYLLGRGAYYYDVRYMGTFNDPNQYGFFILANFFMLSLILRMHGKGILLWAGIAMFLILPSSSAGMALGFLVFMVMFIIFKENTSSSSAILHLLLVCVAALLLYLYSKGIIHLPDSIKNSFMAERFLGKLDVALNQTGDMFHERNWDKVFNNLGYIFIGCGEGVFWRFGNNNEVHSTVFGLIWYYGIFPCYFLISWIRSKLIGISKSVWCVYIALFIEAVTLVNHRQPMFWMILSIAGANFMKSRNYQKYLLGEYKG